MELKAFLFELNNLIGKLCPFDEILKNKFKELITILNNEYVYELNVRIHYKFRYYMNYLNIVPKTRLKMKFHPILRAYQL